MLPVKSLIVEPSRTVLLVTLAVLFCLCPNFLLQASHSVVFCIYKIQLGLSVKTMNMFSVKLFYILESVPTFMEILLIWDGRYPPYPPYAYAELRFAQIKLQRPQTLTQILPCEFIFIWYFYRFSASFWVVWCWGSGVYCNGHQASPFI